MKKTLIALAVAASAAVSGSAMAALGAFSAGNTNASVSISGVITKAGTSNPWVWAVGQPYDKFKHSTIDLSEEATKLTITAGENMSLLVGKVNNAFSGGTGLTPKIQFTDYNGKVTPSWTGSNAKGSMQLAVRDDQQQEIGTMTMNIKAVAPLYYASTTSSSISGMIQSGATDYAFAGAVGGYGKYGTKSEIDEVLTAFGAPATQVIMNQIKKFPGMEGISDHTDSYLNSNYTALTYNNNIYAGAYALGVPVGDKITIKFNKAIIADTKWQTQLNMTVTYV